MSAEAAVVDTLQEALFEIGAAISPANRGAGLLARWLREHGIALAAFTVESPASSAEAGTLDEAWAAAEAALPEGHVLDAVQRWSDGSRWSATTTNLLDTGRYHHSAEGPTPAAALLALAAALRGVPA